MRKKKREVSVYDVHMSLTPEGLKKIEKAAQVRKEGGREREKERVRGTKREGGQGRRVSE